MREIKFRGKRLDNGKWVYGHLYVGRTYTGEEYAVIFSRPDNVVSAGIPIQGDPFILAPSCVYPVDPATVGQFTGLFDKNGNDIYEGDVIQMWLEDSVEPCGGRWHRMYVGFTSEKGFVLWEERMTLEDAEPLHEMLQWKQCDIIGNIHDNPELLNAE